jgi:transcriptional regulator GlxA family with amidase domain
VKHVNVLLFDNFTTLDALGPTEVLARLKDFYSIHYYSLSGGPVPSSAGAVIDTETIGGIEQPDILLVPGGFGTRALVDDRDFLSALKELAEDSGKVLSVCTGSALLAKTGLLDGVVATTNKLAWDWVTAQGEKVAWVRKARWVVDGKYYSSSGVTAGIDMTLGFVADQIGETAARKISAGLEYLWNADAAIDPFA